MEEKKGRSLYEREEKRGGPFIKARRRWEMALRKGEDGGRGWLMFLRETPGNPSRPPFTKGRRREEVPLPKGGEEGRRKREVDYDYAHERDANAVEFYWKVGKSPTRSRESFNLETGLDKDLCAKKSRIIWIAGSRCDIWTFTRRS
jgi:hypothetical protein